ncbi:glycosyltransferase family 9 protein [Azospirillum halopraeferens]|uniref:glycosyltransferase family 9 protein n=1 Tax=Azospirillum halopraeferens TaxID=34010 RepID=UPI00041E60E3|nr:ADP-heptose--LPS heptosyltransferase [Azospirillum halopraeferens]
MYARPDVTAEIRALVERAGILFRRRRLHACLALHGRALALGVDPLETGGERWAAHMMLGEFTHALAISDLVLRRTPRDAFNRGDRPFHERAVWDGRPFDGRRVLVRCYHGLGDIVQFARYLPLLARRARGVAVQAPDAALPLLAGLPGVSALLPQGDDVALPRYDVQTEVMELLHAFRTTPATVPAVVPFPAVTRDRVRRQAAGMTGRARLRIGLAWAAGAWDGGLRSLPPALASRLTGLPGIDWVCLQRGPALAEGLRRLAFCDRGPRSDDLRDTAAAMLACDLVVSVDTVVAHLAGAMAVPVWTLLRYEADWRWMVERDDSPWYPTMRLFRQPAPGNWEAVTDAVAAALRRL